MSSSPHVFSAVLIVGTDAPLQIRRDYLFQRLGATVLGHISFVRQRLVSPYVGSPTESLLQPRETAFVEIATPASTLSDAPMSGLQEMSVIDPALTRSVGTGLLVPKGTGAEDHSQGLTVWLTGLSGAGKTTIARQVQQQLQCTCGVALLDADIIRTYLCKDLGYSKPDREENIRRLGFVADLLTRRGMVVLVTAIAPYRAARKAVRNSINHFIEVYVNAPLATCEERDVKGLYKKARAGEIRLFTGIDDPYEPPLNPEVECRTDKERIECSVSKVIAAIEQKLRSISLEN